MKLFFFKSHYSPLVSLSAKTTQTGQAKELQIIHYCKAGALFDAIRLLSSVDWTKLSNKPFIYASLLQTCTKVGSFNHGLQFHAHCVKSGVEADKFIGNSLLALYFKLGPNLFVARRVFDGLSVKDAVSWTSMITGYIKVEKPKKSLELFWEMLDFGIEPNAHALSAVIKVCSDIEDLRLGKCFHGAVMVRGFNSNHVISCALIDMYGQNYEVNDARRLFDELSEPDSICWTSVISACTKNDMHNEALEFFYLMRRKHHLSPDDFTFGPVLTACGNLGRKKQGKQLHGKVVVSGYSGNVVVESSLVDMYGKCSLVAESQRVFDRMRIKNSVTWSALLGGYCHVGDFESVIRIFRKMEKTDLYCFGTVLRACSGLAAAMQGKEIHCHYVKRGGWRDVIIESALVDLYAKCGCIDFALRVFARMPVRSLITWNSMIYGLAQNGKEEEALKIFHEMIKKGIKPDNISFIGVISSCCHAGLVDQGRKYFKVMVEEYGIKPAIEHYNCMINLLGRAGLIEEAESLIGRADCGDHPSLWMVLLGACASTTHPATAERIAKKTMQLKPDYHLSYVYLTNMYRAAGRWDDAREIWSLMKDRGITKMAGRSWIQSQSNLHCYSEMDDFEQAADNIIR